MKTQIFSVYDSKAEVFNSPIFMATKGMALRSFITIVNNPESDVHKYPGDFTLFHIGEYDDSNGLLTPLTTPVSLGLAQEFLEK